MNKIWISIKDTNYEKIIHKLYEYNIDIYSINYSNSLELLISYDDYIKILKYLKYYDFKVIKYTGFMEIKYYIKQNLILIISFIIGIFVMFGLSNIIVDVKIIHENKKIISILEEELNKYNIKKYTIKKNYDEITQIKNKILNDNKDTLEWIEIEAKGMKYIVKVEERIINKDITEEEYCNIVSKKDSIITKIISSKGLILKNKNNYVNKGDLLITGMINENKICASGTVYGEVWYKVLLTLPFKQNVKEYNNLETKNIMINDHIIFRPKYKNYDIKVLSKKNIFNTKIKVIKLKYFMYKDRIYNEKELINEAIKLANDKISINLKENERIISENVLKKEVIDSTMYIDIFISKEEVISETIKGW